MHPAYVCSCWPPPEAPMAPCSDFDLWDDCQYYSLTETPLGLFLETYTEAEFLDAAAIIPASESFKAVENAAPVLPMEIMQHIMRQLSNWRYWEDQNEIDRLVAGATCTCFKAILRKAMHISKQFNEAAREELWFLARAEDLLFAQPAMLHTYTKFIQVIWCSSERVTSRLVELIDRHDLRFDNVKKIMIRAEGTAAMRLLTRMVDRAPNVFYLGVHLEIGSLEAPLRIARRFPGLRKLFLIRSHAEPRGIPFDALRSVMSLHKLETFYLRGADGKTPWSFSGRRPRPSWYRDFFSSVPKLEHFNCDGTMYFPPETLAIVGPRCPNLVIFRAVCDMDTRTISNLPGPLFPNLLCLDVTTAYASDDTQLSYQEYSKQAADSIKHHFPILRSQMDDAWGSFIRLSWSLWQAGEPPNHGLNSERLTPEWYQEYRAWMG